MDEEKKEEKFDGVSEQNAPANPAEVANVTGGLTINTGNLDDIKLKMDTDAAVMPLQNQIDMLKKRAEEYTPETEEQRKKRERQEKSKKIIGAVSDGLSALGNLYFTHHYAPNMYNHEKGSQLNSTIAAIEKAKAEREKNNDAYYNIAMNIGNLEKERAKTVRELEAQAEARKIARQKAEDAHKKAEADRALDPYRQRGVVADAEKKESDRDYSRIKADNAPEEMRLKNQNLELQGQVHKSTINKNVAQTNKAYNEVRGEKPYAYDRNGKKHYFEKEETAEKFARANGTWVEVDDVTVTDTDSELNGKSSRTVTKKKGYSQKPSGFNKEDYKRNKGQQSAPAPPPLN